MEIPELLGAALEHLKAVDTALNNITKRDPEILDQPRLQAILQQFYDTYAEAKERLEHPTFRIATIGTTSSGKSTLVNALIGHRIAPIEAQEMSAGILRIHHSTQNRLVIHPTIGWQNLTDEDIYNKIKQYMADYHERKKVEPNLPLPEIEVYCPILPVIDRSKIGLPESVNLEILDLPGLKSINDQKHLKLIQDTIKGCFSIVTINYQETDDEKQETLLRELKHIVEWFGGDPKMMIFILNKIDSRTSEDDSIENRIQNLKKEIQTTLGLGTPPEIIPMTALFLYYAQLIYAYSESAYQLDILKNLLTDCANLFARQEEHNEEVADLYDDLRQKSRRKTALTPEESEKLLDYALDLSGGEVFWQTLRKCCHSSFRQSVLAPALLEFIIISQSLEVQLRAILEIKHKNFTDEIEREKQHIKDRENEIKDLFEKTFQNFISKLDEIKELLKLGKISKGYVKFGFQYGTGFIFISKPDEIKELLNLSKIFKRYVTETIDFSDNLKRVLLTKIIVPIKNYLKGSIDEDSLNNQLEQFTKSYLLPRLIKNCENFNKTLDDSIRDLIHALDPNKKDQAPIIVKKVEEKIERVSIALNFDIEEAFEAQIKSLINKNKYIFKNFADSYIQVTIDDLISEINKILPRLSIAQGIKISIKADQFYLDVDTLLQNLSLNLKIPVCTSCISIPETGGGTAAGVFLGGLIGGGLGAVFGPVGAGLGAIIGSVVGGGAGSSSDYEARVNEIKDLKPRIINKIFENWELSLQKYEFINKFAEIIISWIIERRSLLKEKIQEAVEKHLEQQSNEIEQNRIDKENELNDLNQQANRIAYNIKELKKIVGI